MTRGNADRDDRPGSQGTDRAVNSRLLPDGGASRRRLFRSFPDPLVYYEDEGDTALVRAVNPAFEETFDVEESTITDERLVDHVLVDAADRDSESGWTSVDTAGATAWSGGAEESDTVIDAEDVLSRLAEGERITVGFSGGADRERRHFRLEAVQSPDEDASGYLVYTSVTDLRRKVDELRERADRLEQVASVAAHDLRNPLDVAKIRLEAARDTGEDVHFEKLEDALDRIQRLVRDVLSVGADSVGSTDSVVLDDVVEAAWSNVETADASLVLESNLPTIEADGDGLEQILENLFRNAVEHCGQDVTVTVGSHPDGFYVADDGPGIPSSERDRAFEPGYSTADGNTGLGLAIVREVAEDHGWQVALTSGTDGGARFQFTEVDTEGRT